MLTKIHFI